MSESLYTAKVLSSLKKVFSDQEPRYEPECNVLTALKNETVSFQVAYSGNNRYAVHGKVEVESPIRIIFVATSIEVPASFAVILKWMIIICEQSLGSILIY